MHTDIKTRKKDRGKDRKREKLKVRKTERQRERETKGQGGQGGQSIHQFIFELKLNLVYQC